MATADEEAGSKYGVGWLVEHRPDIFENVGYMLTEGGNGTVEGDGISFGIEVTRKIPYWVHLNTTGPSGHASRPPSNYATVELISKWKNLVLHTFTIELFRK
jgi:acetylornithine deacetylase/succinyl-diaminopimelate desuccinylase-like protein